MLIGHEALSAEFKNLVTEKKLAQAYIFSGPARVGKRTFVESLAHFAERGYFSDTEGEGSKVLLDFMRVGAGETGTIGIDQVRLAKEFLWRAPVKSSYRMLLIDGADTMTPEAQNALLKIGEEPPPHGVLILSLPFLEMVLPTLQSRFQNIVFSSISTKEIASWLVRAFKVETAKAKEAALISGGLPGLAWAFVHDEVFQDTYARATKLLSMPMADRKMFVKELVEPETFNSDAFLEALALVVHIKMPQQAGLWHRVMELRRDLSYFNLNPRLQLTALAQSY